MAGRNFWLATASSSLTIGLFFSYSTVIGQLLDPFDDHQAELLGALLNGSGLVGSLAFVLVLARFKISMVRANQLVAFLTMVVLVIFGVFIKDATADIGTVVTLGFVMVPILFCAYELAIEQACPKGSPLGEATPVGVINMLGNGLGFVEIMMLTPILSKGTKINADIALIILAGLQLIAFILIMLVKEDHHDDKDKVKAIVTENDDE